MWARNLLLIERMPIPFGDKLGKTLDKAGTLWRESTLEEAVKPEAFPAAGERGQRKKLLALEKLGGDADEKNKKARGFQAGVNRWPH